MGKDKTIRVRIDESEEKLLHNLEKKYNVTRSRIVRAGIVNYEPMRDNMLYPLNVQEILEPFGENYMVVSCGIIGENILYGKGVWMDLHADYSIPEQKYIQYGNCHLTMKGNEIHIEGGYLDDIRDCLMILCKEREKGGVGMSYFKVYDDDGNVKSHMLTSYEINRQEDSVIAKFTSVNYSVAYELRPDMRFKTVDDIKEYLDNLLETIVTRGYTVKVYEYLVRMYVKIGYEIGSEFNVGQFTGSKI